MIGESLGQDVLTARKNVKVLPTLQLPSQPSIFALGDIIDWDEQKKAFSSYGHGSVIAANILSLLDGSEAKKKYKSRPEMVIISNGKVSFGDPPSEGARDLICMQNGGSMYIGMLWGIIFGNWLARMLKSKDLGVTWVVAPRMNGA